MLEIRHLKTLHALRESDSLVEAAERLHLTQSALSHQFKELEERMGMPLFVRKTKPVRFTSAGLRLLQLADAMCAGGALSTAFSFLLLALAEFRGFTQFGVQFVENGFT